MGRSRIQRLFRDFFLHLVQDARLGGDNEFLRRMEDGAVLPWTPLGTPERGIVVTTDSFVVRPLEFPGGNIGDLAVHGTVNDLAMKGARPQTRPSRMTLSFVCCMGRSRRMTRRAKISCT